MKKSIYYVAIIAFLLRIIVSLFIVDFKNPEMWEFGIIARSLLNGDGYVFPAITKNVTSAFMPPGLPFVYFSVFKLIGDNSYSYFTILIINALLSSISVILLYNVSKNIFNKETAFYSSCFVCLSPILIYSSTTFNSIIFYQVLLLLSLFFLNKIYFLLKGYNSISISKNRSNVFLLSIVLGVFLYFRAEVLIFILLITLFLLFKKKYFDASIVLVFSMLFISPWSVRNYLSFGKIIPVTTSMGYNFYTGHGDDNSTFVYKEKIASLPEDTSFEISQSDISFELAFDYIKDHPGSVILESFNKVSSLWIADSYRATAKHPIYLFTWLSLLLSFIAGSFFVFNDKQLRSKTFLIYTYLIISTILVIVFFNIPRYQIQMSITMIPIAMYGLLNIFPKLKSFILK